MSETEFRLDPVVNLSSRGIENGEFTCFESNEKIFLDQVSSIDDCALNESEAREDREHADGKQHRTGVTEEVI